jgi:hypothetical protein
LIKIENLDTYPTNIKDKILLIKDDIKNIEKLYNELFLIIIDRTTDNLSHAEKIKNELNNKRQKLLSNINKN